MAWRDNPSIGDKKATVLLLRRAPGNLKFLFEAKQALRASIHDSEVACGVVVVD